MSGPGRVRNFAFAVLIGIAEAVLIGHLAKLAVFSEGGITNLLVGTAVACVVLFFVAAFSARTWRRRR